MSKTKLFKKAGVSAIALTLAAGLCVPVPSLYAFAEEAAIEQVDGEALDDESIEEAANVDITNADVNDDTAADETPAASPEPAPAPCAAEGDDSEDVNPAADEADDQEYEWTCETVGDLVTTWENHSSGPDPSTDSDYWDAWFKLTAPIRSGYSCADVNVDTASMTVSYTMKKNTVEWTTHMDGYPGKDTLTFYLPEGYFVGVDGDGDYSGVPGLLNTGDQNMWLDAPEGYFGAFIDEVNPSTHELFVHYEILQTITVKYIGINSDGTEIELLPKQTLTNMLSTDGFRNGELVKGDDGSFIDPYDPDSGYRTRQWLEYPEFPWLYSHCSSVGYGDTGTLTLYFSQQKAPTQTITFSYYGLTGYKTVPGGTGPGGDYPEHEEPIWEEISPSITMNDIIEDDGFMDGSLKWETDPETGEYKQIPLPDIFIEDIDGWEYSHCLSVGDRGQGSTTLYYTKKPDTPDASEYTYDLFYEDEEGNKLLPGTEITTAKDINDILAVMDMPDIDGYTFLRIEPDEESPMWVFHAIYKKNPADETPTDPDTPETPGTPSEGETPDAEPLIETGTTPPSPQEPQETIENDPVPEAESLVQTGDMTPFIPVSVAALASLAALTTAHIARKKND